MSIKVEHIEGNINKDEKFRRIYGVLADRGSLERVLVSRKDATKNRLRMVSDRGRDVLIDVPRGVTLRHGDVLSFSENHLLVIEWIPENTMIITISPEQSWKEQAELAVRLGYILGIKHWPLCIEGNIVLVPVEGTRENTAKAFSNLGGIEVRFEERILETAVETSSYEHSH